MLGMAGWWWSQGRGAHETGRDARLSAPPGATPPAGAAWPRPASGATAATAGASAQSGDTWLAPDLRHRLEAVLLEAGDMPSPEALKQHARALLAPHFTPAERPRAQALLDRYIDYRVALGRIRPPAPGDAQGLRSAVEARQRVREAHFDADELAALFAGEDALDRYTLARLEIQRHPTLTPDQKQAALREAEQELPPAERSARADAQAHLALADQTAAFDAQGLDERQRHAQRSAQHGEAAARRLAQLDRDEADWRARLDRYATAQGRGESPAQLEALAGQLFTPQERLRLPAALALRAQGPAAGQALPAR